MVFPFLRKRLSKFRRGRKYVKSYLGRRRGLSFLQIGSKLRMDPPWKRRKYDALSSQNDEDPTVSINRPQSSQLSTVAPLSSVRFKDPSSTVFDYHHYCTRIRLADLNQAAGAASYLSTVYKFQVVDLPNWANLKAVYERYRISRMVLEAIPYHENAFVGDTAPFFKKPSIYTRIYRGVGSTTTTEAEMLDSQDSVIRNAEKPFAISWTPNALEEVSMEDEIKTGDHAAPQLAPWLSVAKEDINHYGVEFGVRGNQLIADAIAIYQIFVTVYYDMDGSNF